MFTTSFEMQATLKMPVQVFRIAMPAELYSDLFRRTGPRSGTT